MTPQATPKLATAGSLQSDVLADLIALRNFLEGRDRAMAALMGRDLPRNYLRDELVRMVVIEFGFERIRSIPHYQKACVHLGSHAAVRGELQLLAECGLVLLSPGQRRGLPLQVGPSQKLVDWYSSQLPQLMNDVRRFVVAREASQ